MRSLFLVLWFYTSSSSSEYNVTIDYVPLQLRMFSKEHPKPIGLLTTGAGSFVDIRQTKTLNTNMFRNQYFTEEILHLDKERIPERIVHARGTGAHGYFEVTNDVSKYTKADVFNGIGKKTPVFGRFSSTLIDKSDNELARDSKALSVKYYTREGNLDHLGLNHPVFHIKDPSLFKTFVGSGKRNPKTNIRDFTSFWDWRTLRPEAIHATLWVYSGYGIPDGYRKIDIFPIHTFETYNKHGDRYYVKFNYRSEQGLANLTSAEAAAISSEDQDYFTRDLYDAIENGNFPSWRLEMDIMTFEDIKTVNYDPFDITIMWKKGTYFTVPVGRLVFNRNVDNFFAETEQSAFNPANLVPGISGGLDAIFMSRVVSYSDTQHYRLSVNHQKIEINRPKYAENYLRDGNPPVLDNMRDAPNYLINSFNGPLPYIDTALGSERLLVLTSNAADFGKVAEFYKNVLVNENQRRDLAQNIAASLKTVTTPVKERVIKIMGLVNATLGARVGAMVKKSKEKPTVASKERYAKIARCLEFINE